MQLLLSCQEKPAGQGFLRVEGKFIVDDNGEKFFIRGTNLGNWLNPEGYMFGFKRASSASEINRMFCQMVGPDFVADFWKQFKDNYITSADIKFIASTGANTVRLPFNYKMFTADDYMGDTDCGNEGFARIDSVVKWCRQYGVKVILDMHDCPAGQTGDNIDDSYGYPWLFESEASQKLFIDIWVKIAQYYSNEPVILGYDLMNEPIATYFENKEELNKGLLPLYIKTTDAIRAVDKNHIILWGGAQWNSMFEPLEADSYPENVMFTCHRYGGPATADAIRSFIDFRDKSGRPMYMGEIGHNTEQWQSDFVKAMEENDIMWTFWPYKKVEKESFIGFDAPADWQKVVDFAESPRSSYEEVRNARPNQDTARAAMSALLENIKFENCKINEDYVKSLGLNPNNNK